MHSDYSKSFKYDSCKIINDPWVLDHKLRNVEILLSDDYGLLPPEVLCHRRLRYVSSCQPWQWVLDLNCGNSLFCHPLKGIYRPWQWRDCTEPSWLSNFFLKSSEGTERTESLEWSRDTWGVVLISELSYLVKVEKWDADVLDETGLVFCQVSVLLDLGRERVPIYYIPLTVLELK